MATELYRTFILHRRLLSNTTKQMPSDQLRAVVSTRKAPGPSPHNSQAIIVNGPLIFVSGQMGVDVHTKELVKGNIKERVVSFEFAHVRDSNNIE
jgi:hypothetical protein